MEIDVTTPLTDSQRDEMIDSIAHKITDRRMEAPAVLFLEMHKPLSFITSQTILVAMPFIAPLLGPERTANFSKLLQDKDNVERLILRIEELSIDRDSSSQTAIEEQR